MTKLVALLLAVTFSAGAIAAGEKTPIELSLKARVHDIPDALQGLGYSRFGNLKFANFIQDTELVDVREMSSVNHIEYMTAFGPTSRQTAEWYDLRIDASRKMWPKVPAMIQGVLALHEYFGALYGASVDDHFEASATMWFLLQPIARQSLTAGELAGFEQRISQQMRAVRPRSQIAMGGGGAVGVGGGGDIFGARTKMVMFLNGLSKYVIGVTDPAKRKEGMDYLYSIIYDRTEIGRRNP